jgi:hypothetical protein
MSIIVDTFGDKFKLLTADYFETAFIQDAPKQGDIVKFTVRGGGIVHRMIHACDLYFTPGAQKRIFNA